MDQFIEGLASVGLLAVLRANPEVMKPLFVWEEKKMLSGMYIYVILYTVLHSYMYMELIGDLKHMFNVRFSEEGSNERVKQEDTYVYFGDFLDNIIAVYPYYFAHVNIHVFNNNIID